MYVGYNNNEIVNLWIVTNVGGELITKKGD